MKKGSWTGDGNLDRIIHERYLVTAFMRSVCALGKSDPMNRITTSLCRLLSANGESWE